MRSKGFGGAATNKQSLRHPLWIARGPACNNGEASFTLPRMIVYIRVLMGIFQNGMILLMKYTLYYPMEGQMKKAFGMISCMLLVIACIVSSALATSIDFDWDDTTARGGNLGKNEVREFSTSYVYVIGKKLFMHETSDLSSAPVQVLGESDFVELLDSQQGVLYVRDTEGSPNGDVTYIDGWVDERFVAITNRCYVAMHPMPITIAPEAEAKIICMLDTYDSCMIVDEINGYYCVLVNGGIGYVTKE